MVGQPQAAVAEIAPAPISVERAAQPNNKETNLSTSLRREHLKLKDRPGATLKEQDVGLVAIAVIGEKGNKALKGQELNPKLLKKSVGKNEAPILLFSYLLKPDFQGITLSEGLKVVAAKDGSFSVPQTGSKEGQNIRQIFKRDGQFFSCDLGDGKPALIPIETVLSANVVSIFSDKQVTQRLIKDGLFTSQEVQIIQAYVDSVIGKGPQSAEKIDESILREAALSSGLVTTESLKAFTDANMKPREIDPEKIQASTEEEKAKIVAENTEYNQKIEETQKLFEGRIIASPEAVAAVIQTVLPEQVGPLKLSLKGEMVEIKLELGQLKVDDPKDRQKLTELSNKEEQINQQLLLIQQAEGFMKDGQIAVMEVFGSVQRGETGVETIQALDKGLKENNPEGIITALLDNKNIDKDTKEKIKKFDFAKIGKFGGGISLGLFFMLLLKAIKGGGGTPG